jgi:hypothetical protein
VDRAFGRINAKFGQLSFVETSEFGEDDRAAQFGRIFLAKLGQ